MPRTMLGSGPTVGTVDRKIVQLPPGSLQESYAAVANRPPRFSNSRSNLRPSDVIILNVIYA
jgi:hypothetical protein